MNFKLVFSSILVFCSFFLLLILSLETVLFADQLLELFYVRVCHADIS